MNGGAGGLGLVGDDRDFVADESVEERGFADVGAADEGNETGVVVGHWERRLE